LRAEKDAGPAGKEKEREREEKRISFLKNFFSNSFFFKHSNFTQTEIHAFEL
jgi:hypothetical protein